ncbi:ABC transporter substrate-binding protein [Litorilinea aerophila]|uniref:ABC transporter substrate-binding protein n=1 Tax=Litorilinea aerophila TaxID=1204385 RepID=A0A540VET2_9CHLR|nr:ABC transporter substrate-binding protein [Litorilinea aerophila]MCC9077012.1 ABC transporter substrate-binding protein [Litorilinea aerophila]
MATRSTISRRQFLWISGASVVGVVAAACGSPASPAPAEPAAAPAATSAPAAVEAGTGSRFNEAPMLRELVNQGQLPPVDERMPLNPLVSEVEEEIGQYGGTWRRVWLGPSDAYGMWRLRHETLLRWSADSTYVTPNVAESWEVNEDGTEFTIHLREGMRWSDGEPFTADDMLYWYEVQLNPDLTPVKNVRMSLGDEFGKMEKVDDYTVKISFSKSYGLFELQMASEFEPYLPKHYMQQFDPAHADPAELDAKLQEAGLDQPQQLFSLRSSWSQNPDLPVLSPWVVKAEPTVTLWPAERNPYYWKVDEAGNQLPYIDTIMHELLQERELVTLKVVAGEVDMQSRHLGVNDLPLYMENREKGDYRVLMWPTTQGSSYCLMFNQNYDADPKVAEFLRNVDFRRALSLAINREEMNQVVYLGLGTPRQSTLLPQSPGFNEEWATAYTEYDPERANQMLDELGLTERDSEGFRLLPDGSGPLTIVIAHPNNIGSDPTELVKSYWEAVGVKTVIDTQERSVHYEKMHANELQVAPWGNEEMIYPLFLVYPWWVMPYGTSSRIAPLSGLWYQTNGQQGVEPEGDLRRVIELYEQAKATPNEEERFQAAMEMMRINAENLWTVGCVAVSETPVVVKNNFRNVPEKHLHGTVNGSPGNARPWTWFFRQA